ncbi:hypothetical protein [Streptomyces ziwulingensis]|uniref:hypothetical protein n=1 Tax=Streptomyces ziwulingensis TaxID=1045501 RepID=UPI0031E8B419
MNTAGAGAGSGRGEDGHRPDSSGLLGGTSAAWAPHPSEDPLEELAPGAAAGGAALQGSAATNAATHPGERAGETGAAGLPAPDATVAAPVLPGLTPGTATAPGTGRGTQSRGTQATAGTGAGTGTGAAQAEAAPSGSGDVHMVPAPLPDDRVPVVVQQEDTDDVSAWDLAAAGFTPLLLSLAGRGATAGAGGEAATSRYTVADPAIWNADETDAARQAERAVAPARGASASDEGPELATWRPAQRAVAPAAGIAFAGTGEVRSGDGGDLGDEPQPAGPDPEASGDDPDEEDTEENGAVELLRQDASTWGGRSAPVVPDSLG